MYRIGEFSKLAVVPISLLRYYDKIDLFKPNKIDNQSGYRLYAAEQLSRLYRILALKDLGFSLEEITILIYRDIEVDELTDILTKREKEIENAIEAEKSRLQRLRSRLDYLKTLNDEPKFEIIVKSVEAQNFLAHRGSDFYQLGHILQDYPWSNNQCFMVITHSDFLDDKDNDFEVGFTSPERLPDSIKIGEQSILYSRELPNLPMVASTLYTGTMSGAFTAYHALCKWIAPNGFKIVGPNREYFLEIDGLSADAEIVLDIQFPILPIDA